MFSATELSNDYRCSKHGDVVFYGLLSFWRDVWVDMVPTRALFKLPSLKSLQAFFRRLIKIYVVYLLALAWNVRVLRGNEAISRIKSFFNLKIKVAKRQCEEG